MTDVGGDVLANWWVELYYDVPGAIPFFLLFLVRETRNKNTFSVLLLFQPSLPLGIEHSLGQPRISLFYYFCYYQ